MIDILRNICIFVYCMNYFNKLYALLAISSFMLSNCGWEWPQLEISQERKAEIADAIRNRKEKYPQFHDALQQLETFTPDIMYLSYILTYHFLVKHKSHQFSLTRDQSTNDQQYQQYVQSIMQDQND